MAAASSLRCQQQRFTQLQRARLDRTNSFFSAYLNLMKVLREQQLLTNGDSLHEENECEWSVNKALPDTFEAGTFPGLRADSKSLELCNQRKGWS